MNLRTLAVVAVISFLSAYAYGVIQYNIGWQAGVADLKDKMVKEAQAKLVKQVQRQQSNDQKAVDADQQGTAKTVTITRDVIKYVKTPNRTVCEFDPFRVSIKSASVDNANNIAGFDGETVPAKPTSK